MISPDVLITAGHMVYDRESKTYATSLTAYIGHTADQSDLDGNDPEDIAEEANSATSITLHGAYRKKGQAKHDFALVKLRQKFQQVQPITFKDAPKVQPNPYYKIVGYPGDLPFDGGDRVKGRVMHEVQGEGCFYDALETKHTLSYWLDTKSGESLLSHAFSCMNLLAIELKWTDFIYRNVWRTNF